MREYHAEDGEPQCMFEWYDQDDMREERPMAWVCTLSPDHRGSHNASDCAFYVEGVDTPA